jgi:hypothetical protein
MVASTEHTDDEELTKIFAEQQIRLRLLNESTVVSLLLMSKAAELSGVTAEKLSQGKKELQASILVHELGQGWLQTATDFLPGQNLDISTEKDLAIYIEAGQKLISPDADPTRDVLMAIFLKPAAEARDIEGLEQASVHAVKMYAHLLRVKNGENSTVEASALVDELLSQGDINPRQADELRDLVKELGKS